MRRFGLVGVLITMGLVSASAQSVQPPYTLQLPPGFSLSLVSDQVPGARFLAVAPNGDILVSQPAQGRVVALKPGLSVKNPPTLVATGIPRAHGLAFRGQDLYIAGWAGVSVLRNYPQGKIPEVLFNDLPQNTNHNARALALAQDGTVFVSVGSSCNVCRESDNRLATILKYSGGNGTGTIHASGLRNASGLTFDAAGRLWAVVNQRDNLSPDHTDLPPDEINLIQAGGNYGWPYAYPVGNKRVVSPEFPGSDVSGYLSTTFNIQAHSAPLQTMFYKGAQFPNAYQNALIVALHGSWNRSPPTGYKVVALSFANGQPTVLSDLVSGWLTPDGRVLGRPVGLAEAADGSLYISDDRGYVLRLSYQGK